MPRFVVISTSGSPPTAGTTLRGLVQWVDGRARDVGAQTERLMDETLVPGVHNATNNFVANQRSTAVLLTTLCLAIFLLLACLLMARLSHRRRLRKLKKFL